MESSLDPSELIELEAAKERGYLIAWHEEQEALYLAWHRWNMDQLRRDRKTARAVVTIVMDRHGIATVDYELPWITIGPITGADASKTRTYELHVPRHVLDLVATIVDNGGVPLEGLRDLRPNEGHLTHLPRATAEEIARVLTMHPDMRFF